MTKSALQSLQIAHRRLKREADRVRASLERKLAGVSREKWVPVPNFSDAIVALFEVTHEVMQTYVDAIAGGYSLPDGARIVRIQNPLAHHVDLEVGLLNIRWKLKAPAKRLLRRVGDEGLTAYRPIEPSDLVGVMWRPSTPDKSTPRASRCKISTPKER